MQAENRMLKITNSSSNWNWNHCPISRKNRYGIIWYLWSRQKRKQE